MLGWVLGFSWWSSRALQIESQNQERVSYHTSSSLRSPSSVLRDFHAIVAAQNKRLRLLASPHSSPLSVNVGILVVPQQERSHRIHRYASPRHHGRFHEAASSAPHDCGIDRRSHRPRLPDRGDGGRLILVETPGGGGASHPRHRSSSALRARRADGGPRSSGSNSVSASAVRGIHFCGGPPSKEAFAFARSDAAAPPVRTGEPL